MGGDSVIAVKGLLLYPLFFTDHDDDPPETGGVFANVRRIQILAILDECTNVARRACHLMKLVEFCED